MLLKSEERIKEINTKLACLAQYVKFNNQQGMTDINKAVENFFCGLLNIIFDASLENMNYIQRDYPAVDLGDEENRLAVQVTSTSSRDKIIHTLDKFFEHRLDQHYNRLVILIVGKKEAYKKKFQTKRNFPFDKDRDIWDVERLGKEIDELDDDAQEAVNQYLDKQMKLPWEEYQKAALQAESKPEPEIPPVSGEKKLKYLLPTTLGPTGFMGRVTELEQLKQALDGNENPIFITGLGGMGKTELAIRFCQEQKDFKAHFVRFAGTFEDTVIQSIALGVENLWLSESRPKEQIYHEVMRVLEDCDDKTILVIDNADPANGEFDSLKDKTYQKLCDMGLRLVITTRATVRGGVAVKPMEPEQLLEIMNKYVQYPDDELLPLIEAVNRHTLTVDLMARTLDESCDDVSPAMLLEALRNSTLPEEDYPEVTTDHNRDDAQLQIYAHLRSLFNVVQLDADAQIALGCATLLPEGGMATPLFRHSLPAGAREAFKTLKKRGFLRTEAGVTTIHPVIRLVARHELKPTDESCRVFLETLWSNYDKKKYDHDLYSTMAELYTTAAEILENERGGWSGHGRALWDEVGQYDKAVDCARMTIERREASLPADHPELARAYTSMGAACSGLGDHRGMTEYYGKAMDILKRTSDADNVDLAASYMNMGSAYHAQGDYQTALIYKLQAMKVLEKVLRKDDLYLATAYSRIGSSYGSLGDFSRALEYREKALGIYKRELPADHLDLAAAYANTGGTYGHLGNYNKALEYREKALEIAKKLLPSDHLFLASHYNGVGSTWGSLGDHRKELEYKKKALNIQEKTLPTDHPDFAASYFSIGYTYSELGDNSKALEYYKKALVLWESVLPADHPSIALCYNNMGHIYGDINNYPLSLKYLEKAYSIWKVKLPLGHENIRRLKDDIAKVKRKLENQRPAWMDQIN